MDEENLDYEGNSSYDEGKYSADSQEEESQDQSSDDGDGAADGDGSEEERVDTVVVPSLSLCTRHKPGQMVEVCLTCRAALGIVRPEVAKQLLAPSGPAPSMSAAHRYAARSDDRAPTLHFSEGTMELAEGLFSALTYRNKGHFGDMTKKYLFLPCLQNDALAKTLHSEPMFRRFEGEPRFKHIFAYKRDLGDGLKNLRIIQRPLLKITEVLDGFLLFMRSTGEAANFQFPAEAPIKSDPSCPKEFVDHLTFENTHGSFPLPDLTPVLSGVSDNLTEEDRNTIIKNCQLNEVVMREYRDFVIGQFAGMYVEARHVAQKIDALLNFYCDLYGHVDASFRELLRNKLVQLFKTDLRDSVLGRDAPREERKKDRIKGLLGGEDKVRSVLADATKQDELLRKAVLPRRAPKSRVSKGGQPGTSGTQSSNLPRSRSPRRSAADRSYSGGRGGRSIKQPGKERRGGKDDRKGAKQGKKKDTRKESNKKE